LALALRAVLDTVDDETKLRRDLGLAVGAARDAGTVLDEAHLLTGHGAVAM
jgi:hypothetical protein